MKYKYIFIGDIHLGKFKDITIFKTFWESFLKPMCDEETILFFTGDQFDSDRNVDTEFLCDVISVFSDIHKIIKQSFFIIGNHCTHKRTNISVSMNTILTPFPKFKIIEFGSQSFDDATIHFVSYVHDPDMLKKKVEGLMLDEDSDNILISHADIKELIFDNGSPIEYGVDKEIFKNFDKVINGHIHRNQKLGNIFNIGSPYQMKYSDQNNVCGVLATNNLSTEYFDFIPNNVSPKYIKLKKEEVFAEENREKLENRHVWVIDVTDVDEIKSFLDEKNIVSTRVNFVEQEETKHEEVSSFDYQHDSDPLDSLPKYLSSVEEISYKNVHVKIDSEVQQKIQQKIQEL